jgi:hypothetical protein
MTKTVTVRLDDETYRSFAKRARAENRSLANFIETSVKEHVRECDFVDDSEMAEILANEQLVERLRAGSKNARQRIGSHPPGDTASAPGDSSTKSTRKKSSCS